MLPMVQAEPVLFNCASHTVEAAPPSANLPPSLTPATPDSEVEELVDIFFGIDVAVNTFPRVESCDLQLGDTWRWTHGKMSVTAPVKKIRKKSDNKPQSQINKCIVEKRRREVENEVINQLEELLETRLAEVKQPDKNGIVKEATRQIQQVLRRRCDCPEDCPLRLPPRSSPVQAGEVTSTQSQTALAAFQYSDVTSLIEALKHYTGLLGLILMEINSKGEVECVTENIKDLIYVDKTELYKKSVFSLLHANDHAKLKPLLRHIENFGWNSGEVDKFHKLHARLLLNNSDGAGLVNVIIHAAPVRGSSSEEAGSVMCVIRRCDDASAGLLPSDGGPPAIPVKHCGNTIVFRLDCNFTILSCDLSCLENYSNSLNLVGTRYLDLVQSSDRVRVTAHLEGAVKLPGPPATSEPFRLRIAADKPWIRVSAYTRFFVNQSTSGEPDFIMSTHTVLGDDEVDILEVTAPTPDVGGPLMTSVANGESSTCESRPISLNDFDFESWAQAQSVLIGVMSEEDSKDQKESMPEEPSTPHAPTTPSSDVPPLPVPHEESNRLRVLLSKKSTPAADGLGSNNRILKNLLKQDDEDGTSSETSAPQTPHTPLTPHTPHTPHTPAAALSPLHSAQAQARIPQHVPHASHASHPPLTPHPSHTSHPPHTSHSPLAPHTPNTPHTPHTPHASHAPHPPHTPHPHHGSHQPTSAHTMQQPSHHNNSDVLLGILNDKSDEDGEDARRNSSDGSRGASNAAALSVLSQLLSSNGPSGNGRSQEGSDSYLERLGVKRKFEEPKTSTASNVKRATPENQQVTSSAGPVSVASSVVSTTAGSPATSSSAGMSPLCQKNQILVSLLARQQPTPTTPPPLPNPTLRVYGPIHPTSRPRAPQVSQRQHHHTLSTILTTQAHRMGNLNGGGGSTQNPECGLVRSHLQMVLQGASRSAYQSPAPSPMHYGTLSPHPHYNNQDPGSSSRGQGTGDGEVPSSDQTLSDILDEVIESLPPTYNDRQPPDHSVLMELETNRQMQSDGMKEKNAMINAITQSLMQCETVSKSPVSSSPSTPMAYPVQSPGSSGMGSVVSSGGALYSMGGAAGAAGAGAARDSPDTARAREIVVQHRIRLLHQQLSQHMLVSPEAAEQPQSDLGSALVTGPPPNVALTRTPDFHHLYHQPNQMGSTYGTNKITSSQQNPMLSRQLRGSTSGAYGHGSVATHPPAALHSPVAPQPYHRAPRPHLVGGYYEEGDASAGGYCGDYRRQPHPSHAPHAPHPPHPPLPPHPPPHDHQLSCGGVGGAGVPGVASGGTSEYVRNELRAVVGARSARPDLHGMHAPDLDPLLTFDMPPHGGGSAAGGRAPAAAPAWDATQSTSSTTEPGSAAAAAAASAAAGGDETAGAGCGGGGAGGSAPGKASLLQKLLSQ